MGSERRSRVWLCVRRVVLATVVSLTPSLVAAQSADYVLGSQDVLAITVWNQQDLSGAFRVESDGTFTFPLIGRVKAAGQTQRDVETVLRRRLAEGYFKQPQVSVAVKEFRRQEVHVVGEVRQPGTYALSGDITVVAALARAGSTTPAAGSEVVIVRSGGRASGPQLPEAPNEKEENNVVRVDLRKLEAGTLDRSLLLLEGDTLFVPAAATVFVSGHVKAPGAYPVGPTMTVLQALSLAGGITDRGASGRIKIVRIGPDGRSQEIKAKLSDPVRAGDTIVVPERFF
jgi:polysaccharide export outer membrane protein